MTTTRDSQSFARTLRHYREAAGLSQEALAERAGLSARGLSDLERGLSRAPRLHTLSRLAEALALSATDREVLLRASGRLSALPAPAAPVDGASIEADQARRPPAGLPGYLTSLLGRERDEAGSVRLLRRDDVRLLTMVGPGGVGKTRLAVHVAARLADTFPDGVAFAPLAPLRDPSLVLATIAQAVGVGETGDASLTESLILALHARRLLLVLDNCEHVLEAAPLVARVLVRCPGVRVLATSRTPLRLQGEQVFPVRPLPVPDDGISAQDALEWASVALFIERAQAVWPGFSLTDNNLHAVVGICRRLDGLPLALELAAARVAVLPPAALLERLQQQLPVLSHGARDAPARHRKLQATIAWSYDLLLSAEQRLFRWLSVFRGGWSLELAEAVCDSEHVLDELATLVEHSLVQPVDDLAPRTSSSLEVNGEPLSDTAEPRFIMLVTVGVYAFEQLLASGEAELAYRHHAEAILRLAENAEPHLVSAERLPWLQRLDLELDNIRGALTWSLSPNGDPEIGMRLTGSLAWYFYLRGHLGEGRAWAEQLLAHAPERATLGRARCLFADGGLSLQQGDASLSQRVLVHCVEFARALGDHWRLGHMLSMLGLATTSLGEPLRALDLYRAALTESKRQGDTWLEAQTLTNMGAAEQLLGDASGADERYRASLALFVDLDDDWGRGIALRALAGLAADQDDHVAAQALYEESVPFFRHTGDTRGLAQALLALGKVALRGGQPAYARAILGEAIARWREVGISAGIVRCLAGLAGVAATEDERERAVRLYAATSVHASAVDVVFAPVDQAERERSLGVLRTRLDDSAFAAAWAAGQALSLDQAIDTALGGKLGTYPPLITHFIGLR